MQEIQAIIQGTLAPQAINIDSLIALTKLHTDPNSEEYQLLEIVTNMVLASYLEQAQKHI